VFYDEGKILDLKSQVNQTDINTYADGFDDGVQYILVDFATTYVNPDSRPKLLEIEKYYHILRKDTGNMIEKRYRKRYYKN